MFLLTAKIADSANLVRRMGEMCIIGNPSCSCWPVSPWNFRNRWLQKNLHKQRHPCDIAMWDDCHETCHAQRRVVCEIRISDEGICFVHHINLHQSVSGVWVSVQFIFQWTSSQLFLSPRKTFTRELNKLVRNSVFQIFSLIDEKLIHGVRCIRHSVAWILFYFVCRE